MGLFDFLLGNSKSQAQQAAAQQAQKMASQQAILQGITMMSGHNPTQPVYAPPYAAHPVTYNENMQMTRGILGDSKRRKRKRDEDEELERERRRERQADTWAPSLGSRYGS